MKNFPRHLSAKIAEFLDYPEKAIFSGINRDTQKVYLDDLVQCEKQQEQNARKRRADAICPQAPRRPKRLFFQPPAEEAPTALPSSHRRLFI